MNSEEVVMEQDELDAALAALDEEYFQDAQPSWSQLSEYERTHRMISERLIPMMDTPQPRKMEMVVRPDSPVLIPNTPLKESVAASGPVLVPNMPPKASVAASRPYVSQATGTVSYRARSFDLSNVVCMAMCLMLSVGQL